MARIQLILFITAFLLVTYGYHLLAVPPDASAEEMLSRAKNGMFSVVGGGTLLMLWLAKR